ncbi:uncharacterized protein LOC125257574 isoform X2 [Megalobrama amblycephala]|uniref:uncharacterized protein LOC125257574 isoform X2 n=1 Tax=Megalobrama amblycephala TaxID=75352 RepID=UPI002013CEB3|nr:uncharacterized protein LOC125257574 isoform X2 [Megalobrama amblycephala]
MMLRGLIYFTFISLTLTEGSSVKVHPGGNTTLPCNIKDDKEITWIITNGNQTFVRILKMEHLYGGKPKPEPTNIHPSYAGRIKALSSSTNTHSLLLMNISDTDLMLYCCTECRLEQTHCTKLDFEDESTDAQQDTKNFSHDPVTCGISLWLPIVCVPLALLSVSNACLCWIRKRFQDLRAASTNINKSQQTTQGDEDYSISYASVNMIKGQKNRSQHHLTQDTVYASIK